jgi:hypothetical protein
MVPEADRVVCDKVGCARVKGAGPNSGVGIGTGREYGTLPEVRAADKAIAKSWGDRDGCTACSG